MAALYAAGAGHVAPSERAALHVSLGEARAGLLEVIRAESLRRSAHVLTRAEASVEALARLLMQADLPARVAAARARSVDPARLDEALIGFTLLSDHAVHALDYRTVGVGMFEGHPECRRRHRARAYAPAHLARSAARQAASRAALGAALTEALAGGAAAVEAALVQGFLREVGLGAGEGRRASAPAVLQTLEDELFVPLRALLEALDGRARFGEAVHARMRAVVIEAGEAVVQGNFHAWRTERPAAQEALAWLPGQARAAWLAGGGGAHPGPDGVRLTTREPRGHALFWATKVGGPSHAFDTMNHCILSLLSNPRTSVVAVEDPRWHQGAARAYLRLLPDESGRPVLYLEPPELDFPYRAPFGGTTRAWIAQALLLHARRRGAELGAALMLTWPYRAVAEGLGLQLEAARAVILLPSPAVVEASDTLRPDHDWVQDELQVVRPDAFSVVG